VVRPYEELELVRIGRDPAKFIRACEDALAEDSAAKLAEVDRFLADISWDRTWARMQDLMVQALVENQRSKADDAPRSNSNADVGSDFAARVPDASGKVYEEPRTHATGEFHAAGLDGRREGSWA